MLQCELNWFLSFCAAPLCLLTCHQSDANPGNQSATLSMQDWGFVRLSQQTDMVLAPKRVYCTADSIEITATHPGWEKSYLWELQAKQECCEGKSNAKCSCQQDKGNNETGGAEGHRIQELDTRVKRGSDWAWAASSTRWERAKDKSKGGNEPHCSFPQNTLLRPSGQSWRARDLVALNLD